MLLLVLVLLIVIFFFFLGFSLLTRLEERKIPKGDHGGSGDDILI